MTVRRAVDGVEYDDLSQGAGSLNAAGALDLARAIDTAVPVDNSWWTTNVTPASSVGGETYAWSEHIVWGTNYIGAVEGNHIVWGTATDPISTVWSNLAEAPPGDQ